MNGEVDDKDVEWVVMKHVRFPFPEDTEVSRHTTRKDAQEALDELLHNAQWFTTYGMQRQKKKG